MKESEANLRKAVIEYLNELASPAPDATMRFILRKKLAEMVGVEDPTESRRKWDESAKRSGLRR